MKLRLRNLESKETLRFQVPSPCTLYELQQILSQSLSPPPPSRSALRFSRNARHDLSPSSPDASLESLGISSGDLVYFSTNPKAFSPKPSMRERDVLAVVPESHQIPRSSAHGDTSIPGTRIQDFVSSTSEKLESTANLEISRLNRETVLRGLPKIQYLESNQTPISQETHRQSQNCSNQQESRSQALRESQHMGEKEVKDIVKKFSEPYFLRKVLREEFGDNLVDHKIIVIAAVHAVLLESGFIGLDATSRTRVDHFHLPNERPSAGSTISHWYTLPEFLTNSKSGSDVTDYVVIKFQNQGNILNVDGCMVKDGSVYRVCLDKSRFAPSLKSAWAHCDDEKGSRRDEDVSLNSNPDKEVFKFWKTVKDGLALPLLIDLCESSGLARPACLMYLPTELKLKIVESLPAKALARVACVCSEMLYLASNNDLWKQKVIEDFGEEPPGQQIVSWKRRYAELYKPRQRMIPDWHPTPTSHLVANLTPLTDFEVEMDLLRFLPNLHNA